LLILYLRTEKKKNFKKTSSTATVQNWTPLCRGTQEVCDFLDTSSKKAHKHTKTCKSSVSTYNQPNLESTQNQPRFLRLKFWALDIKYTPECCSGKKTNPTPKTGDLPLGFTSRDFPFPLSQESRHFCNSVSRGNGRESREIKYVFFYFRLKKNKNVLFCLVFPNV
jgi:hypothetical protein